MAKKEISKKTVSKNVEEINRAPLQEVSDIEVKEKKTRKPTSSPGNPKQWLDTYIADTSKSGAKLVTALFAKEEGCSIENASAQALELAKGKGSKWGTVSNVRSHIAFLKQKGINVEELQDGVFRISA